MPRNMWVIWKKENKGEKADPSTLTKETMGLHLGQKNLRSCENAFENVSPRVLERRTFIKHFPSPTGQGQSTSGRQPCASAFA